MTTRSGACTSRQTRGFSNRRALVAAPLVCHLVAFPKRHFDSGGEIGIALLEIVPPVGLPLVVVERTLDGLYWLRRRLD